MANPHNALLTVSQGVMRIYHRSEIRSMAYPHNALLTVPQGVMRIYHRSELRSMAYPHNALLTVPQGVMRICHRPEGLWHILITSYGTANTAFIIAPKRK